MSLLKFALAFILLTLVPAVAMAQDRAPAVAPAKPAPPIADHPRPGGERATTSERGKTSARATTAEAKDTASKAWDETKAMTRKQWDKARKTWAKERDKWRTCNRQSRAQKLRAPKRWTFIAHCMTR